MKDAIKNIEEYLNGFYEDTPSQPHKPFFTLYAKERSKFNLMRYIFGKFKFKWFEESKQPLKYKNAFQMVADSIDLDTKNVKFIEKK